MAAFRATPVDLDAPRANPVLTIEGTDATADQSAYVDAANTLAVSLQNDQAADNAAAYAAELADSRRATRQSVAAELSSAAAQFAGAPTAAPSAIDPIASRYRTGLKKFAVHPKPADTARFENDFEIAESRDIFTAGERAFVDQVNAAAQELAADAAADKSGDLSSAALTTRAMLRKDAAEAYQAFVTQFQGAGDEAVVEVALRRGRYQALRDRIRQRLFRVELDPPVPDDDRLLVRGPPGGPRPGAEDVTPELHMRLRSGLLPPEDKPSPEKLELYVQLYKTNAIIRAIYARSHERASRQAWGAGLWPHHDPARGDGNAQARRLYIEFLRKLKGVAIVGLEMDFTQLAKSTLAELRAEYFMLQAGRIKRQHAQALAVVATAAALAFLISYAIICWVPRPGGVDTWNFFFREHKNFLLAGAGAAIATWASFMARQVTFTFDDLLLSDDSSLPAVMRVTFVVILTMAACLLFWTGALNIEVGDLKTKGDVFSKNGTVAFLIGVLCGFSERALATAITGRAAAFVRTVGG